jgi:PIN domain nuclease of toxin-antitoxin system
LRLLLDTHVIVALLDENPERFGRAISALLASEKAELFASCASIWEIAIKIRLDKMKLSVALPCIESGLARARIATLPVTAAHATADGALAGHPLAAF